VSPASAVSMWRNGRHAGDGTHKAGRPSKSLLARRCGSNQVRPSRMPSTRRGGLLARSPPRQRNPRCGSNIADEPYLAASGSSSGTHGVYGAFWPTLACYITEVWRPHLPRRRPLVSREGPRVQFRSLQQSQQRTRTRFKRPRRQGGEKTPETLRRKPAGTTWGPNPTLIHIESSSNLGIA